MNSPVVSSVYFQANLVKGYRFWDEAGLLANKYVDRFQTVDYGSRPHTLTCAAPRDPGDFLTELRISPQAIWLAYRAGVSWVTMRQETTRDVDWIARAIGVTQFSRLGLRVSLLWEGEDRAQVIDMLLSKVLPIQQQGWSQAGQVTGGDLILHLTADRLTTRIAISSVVNALREERVTIPGQDGVPPPVDLDLIPDFALNVDVDLTDSRITDSLDVKPHLNRSVDYLQGILIPFISHLLQENS